MYLPVSFTSAYNTTTQTGTISSTSPFTFSVSVSAGATLTAARTGQTTSTTHYAGEATLTVGGTIHQGQTLQIVVNDGVTPRTYTTTGADSTATADEMAALLRTAIDAHASGGGSWQYNVSGTGAAAPFFSRARASAVKLG